MTDLRCRHGDPTCPCNDGDACNYEPATVNNVVSPAAPCRNPVCATCRSAARVFTLRHDERPWTLNVERSGSTSMQQRARLVRSWRTSFAWLAKAAKIPPLQRIIVIAAPELVNRRSMPDTGACIGAAKAAIDGLVDAGVLEDDGPDRVLMLTFVAPVVTGVDALVLHVVDATGAPSDVEQQLGRHLRSVS